MNKLNSDDFDDFYDVIKAQSHGRCETNVLYAAFKVWPSSKLDKKKKN